MSNGGSPLCRKSERGIALLSALLILILLSALGVALLYKVTYEQHLQKSDSSNSVAYYGAQAAMEKMSADLDNLFAQEASPSWCDIQKVTTTQPSVSDVNVTYAEYQITIPNAPTDCSVPPSSSSQITQGPNAGLYAAIVPLTLRVTADHQAGNQSAEEVRMVRQVEIAEIPVFQFGVYSTTDISFFAGDTFDFNGRVHTNSNLFLASGSNVTLTFHTPIRAAGDIIRDQLANGLDTAANSYDGTVLVPTTTAGCDGTQPSCRALQLSPDEGSSKKGPSSNYGMPAGSGTENKSWPTISNTNYNGMILSGATGAKQLNMAFVQSGIGPIEILRRPAGEAADSALGESRLYNQAQIRVLLSDDPAELPGGASDGQNIRLANVHSNSLAPDYSKGVPVSSLPSGSVTYFAEANTASGTSETNWTTVPGTSNSLLVPTGAPGITASTWNLLDGYLRVEYRASDGTYKPITQEWLELGFARGFNPPTSASPNKVHPNAILILQQLADRDGDGKIGTNELGGTAPYTYGPGTKNNWYPINIYDPREGEFRNKQATNTTCHVGGVLNLLEIDVNNLRKWLAGSIGTSGTSVEYTSQNGYILYVSDRRGMRPNQNLSPSTKNGEYGYEDVINAASYSGPAGAPCPGTGSPSTTGTPNKCLDSGEDVDQNGKLDTWGAANLGLGFGSGKSGNPFTTVTCLSVARPNWVSGARHGVRLEDGAVGQLPARPDGKVGGFTLGSENSAYVLGDYNAQGPTGYSDTDGHVSAALIADTVTLLSNSWMDWKSFNAPTDSTGRVATETWFRVAIASGKNISFPRPGFTGVSADFGTDGGVHNFLRYLESWNKIKAHYLGSMAIMYYSQYATGVFKCCDMVYQPPSRVYAFDTDFLDLNKLPPGTPRFRDVETIGFQQVF